MLFPTALVGSYPQPEWLIDPSASPAGSPACGRASSGGSGRCRRSWTTRRGSQSAQEEAGLDIITDGEIRREAIRTGLRPRRRRRHRQPGRRSTAAVIEPRAARRRAHPPPASVEVEDLKFLKRHTDRLVKMTVPGPFTMSQQAQVQHYGGSRELAAMDYATAVSAEIRDLFAAGGHRADRRAVHAGASDDARAYGLRALIVRSTASRARRRCTSVSATRRSSTSGQRGIVPARARGAAAHKCRSRPRNRSSTAPCSQSSPARRSFSASSTCRTTPSRRRRSWLRVSRARCRSSRQRTSSSRRFGMKYLPRDVALERCGRWSRGPIANDANPERRSCVPFIRHGRSPRRVSIPLVPATVTRSDSGSRRSVSKDRGDARKRDEAALVVPVAISAFNSKEIESAGILRPQDFIQLTPNMTMVQTQNQGTSFIVVRGISQARNSEPSVAVLIDGVLMANPSQFNQELYDISSIEVLKGPQGALYGRNAIGGAIIINTKDPGDHIEGKVMAGYDSGPGYKARLSAADRSAARRRGSSSSPGRTSTPTGTSTTRTCTRRPIRSRTSRAGSSCSGSRTTRSRPTCGSRSRTSTRRRSTSTSPRA